MFPGPGLVGPGQVGRRILLEDVRQLLRVGMDVPRALGLHTIHYHNADDLRAALAPLGVAA